MKKIGKKQVLVLSLLLIVGLILTVWKGADALSQSASKDKETTQTQGGAQSSHSSRILSVNEDAKSVDVEELKETGDTRNAKHEQDAIAEIDEAGNVVVALPITSSSSNVSNAAEVLARNGDDNDSCIAFTLAKDEILKDLDSGNSFVSKLFSSSSGKNIVDDAKDFYIEENMNNLKPGKGSDIRMGRTKNFDYACERLPVKDDECYVASKGDWLANLIGDKIPFGDKVKNAIDEVSQTVEQGAEEVADFADDFGLLNVEELLGGSCFAANKDMMVIAENPGFPPTYVYRLCNCLSMRTSGTPKCIVQPFFRGIGVSSAKSLRFDVERLRPDGSFTVFDGYAEYSFQVDADLWLDFALKIAIPKMLPGGLKQDSLCPAPETDPPAPKKEMPEFLLKTSIFIKDDSSGSGEIMAVAAVDYMKMVFKGIIEIDLGAALAALRIRSSNAECFPSGFFLNAEIEPKLDISDDSPLKPLMFFIPSPKADIASGVTWLDNGTAEGAQDIIQSFFLKADLEYEFLGMVQKAKVEFQYFDDKEFIRRKNFDKEKCCDNDLSVSCTIPDTALNRFVNDDNFSPKPTIGIYAGVEDISFAFGLVVFRDINLELIVQLDLDGALRARAEADIKALFVEIYAQVLFEKYEDNWMASFQGEIEANIGVGTVTAGVIASVSVGEYTVTERERMRMLQIIEDNSTESEKASSSRELALGSFKDADWDLEFYSDWETAQWVEDLGEFIYDGLVFIYDELSKAWNDLVAFVEKAWEDIKALAALIGGEIAKFFEGISEAIGEGGKIVDDGVDYVVAALDGVGLDGLGDILDVGADFFVGSPLRQLGSLSDAGAKMANGDIWGGLGDAAVSVVYNKYKKNIETEKTGNLDEKFSCPLMRTTWEECKEAGFIFKVTYECKSKQIEYPEQSCVEEKVKRMRELEDKARDAQDKSMCRKDTQSNKQGIQYVGSADKAEVKSKMGAEIIPQGNISLGKLSDINANNGCQKIPFGVKVNKLRTNTGSFGEKGIKRDISSDCINFNSKDTLEVTLGGMKDDVVNLAVETSSGDQSLQKDELLRNCTGDANGVPQCSALKMTGGNRVATKKCNSVSSTTNLQDLFGEVEVHMDPRCKQRLPYFSPRPAEIESECGSARISFDRVVEDCCGKKKVMEHVLVIEPVPPVISTEDGALDKRLACDANIHPLVLGAPEFEAGCDGMSVESSVEDSEGVFDQFTCTTTIERTFTIKQNQCDDNAQTFLQTIVLENNYNPEWESFPNDATVDVFGDYGTEILGFPTVYQRCGASPVHITYTDTVEPGSCFAERILKRTFKATDVCGHVSERVQTITITNQSNALPLGEKSLAKIYGRSKLELKHIDPDPLRKYECIWDAVECGLRSTDFTNLQDPTKSPKAGFDPSDYQCDTANEFEFDSFQQYLQDMSTSLDRGISMRECICEEATDCDVRTTTPDYFEKVYYGNLVVGKSGKCTDESVVAANSNKGQVETSEVAVLSPSAKSSQPQVRPIIHLNGQNDVYNIFDIAPLDMSKTIEIDVPPSSVVLINVYTKELEEKDPKYIYLGDKDYYGLGVRMVNDGMTASNIIWNIVSKEEKYPIDIKLEYKVDEDWQFCGTVLNSRGAVKIRRKPPTGQAKYELVKNLKFQGQIISDYFKGGKHVDFECGHFTGFASCDDVVPIGGGDVETVGAN